MKELIEIIKQLRKTDRGKAILFFIISFFFFLFIMIYSRVIINKNEKYQLEHNQQKNEITKLLNKNYSYTYTIKKDNKIQIYNGKINKDLEEYIKIENSINYNYFRNKDKLYIFNNNKWNIVEKDELLNLTEIEKVSNLIKKSTLQSTTNYESKRKVYNLLISTNTINKEIYNLNTDIDEIPNEIKIDIDENKNINSITYKLNSFCQSNNKCSKLEIEMKYENIDKINELNKPLK